MAKKVLVVDDEKLIVKGIRFSLEQDGMEVDCAYDGEEALKLATENNYDMVLLDIMLPKMDGFEVLAYIIKNHWNDNFAVIMISAHDSPANIKRAYDLGAFDYISRPFDSAIVQRRISNTMFLYARQQHLEKIIVEQVHKQEKNNELMFSILSHIV